MEHRIEKVEEFSGEGNILYLMNRDQRVHDNYCIELGYSMSKNIQFYISICLNIIKMNEKQKTLILEGLLELEKECTEYNLHFLLIESLNDILDLDIQTIITEFNPLRDSYKIVTDFCVKNKISLYICDSHNLVPCKLMTEYKKTVQSVRKMLYRHWSFYFQDFEKLKPHKHNRDVNNRNNFPKITTPIAFKGGYKEGMKLADDFFKNKLEDYIKNRNKPNLDNLSNLSPYIHTGQISSQKVMHIAYTKYYDNQSANVEAFINEIFIFKEISDYFVYHEPNYDNINGALDWAKETLIKHESDERFYIYDLKQLENGGTHDKLWNAGQNQMVYLGKMHGYVRMYWAKKILEWTESPSKAIEIAIYLNDKYSIDGNDPNGYAGIMWSICATFDRGFKERPIIGKIRPIKPFSAISYVKKWGCSENAIKNAYKKINN